MQMHGTIIIDARPFSPGSSLASSTIANGARVYLLHGTLVVADGPAENELYLRQWLSGPFVGRARRNRQLSRSVLDPKWPARSRRRTLGKVQSNDD